MAKTVILRPVTEVWRAVKVSDNCQRLKKLLRPARGTSALAVATTATQTVAAGRGDRGRWRPPHPPAGRRGDRHQVGSDSGLQDFSEILLGSFDFTIIFVRFSL